MRVNLKVKETDLAMLRNKFKQLGELSKKELSNELGKTALDIVGRAKGLATSSVDTGQLRNSINAERLNDKNVRIYVNKQYAPFVEFGTGRTVNLQWLQQAGFPSSYASKFKGKGIKQINLPPRPYFFPAVRTGFQKLEQRLEQKIKDLSK